MAKGSERFAWKYYPGARRVCCLCGRKLRVADVAIDRINYPSQRREFVCTDCQRARVAALVAATKRQMGMEA